MLARLAPIVILLAAACSDPAELPESMQLTGVAGTAMGDAQCGNLVGVPPAAPFTMNIRNHSDPVTCTCASDSALTGSSPCSFDGNQMTCPVNDGLTVWSVTFDPEAMTASVSVTRGTCSASVAATVAELTAN